MNRNEFFAELERLLGDISSEERNEALEYYREYFEEAGPENEEEVLRTLGSPQKVAENIRAGLGEDSTDKGEFTERGFEGYAKEEKQEVMRAPKKLGKGMWILILIAVVFAWPLIGGTLLGILGAAAGILLAAVGILVAALVAGVGCGIAGVALIGIGISSAFVNPLVGLCLTGAGLIVLAIGILLGMLGLWILKIAVPPIIRGIVSLGQKILKRN